MKCEFCDGERICFHYCHEHHQQLCHVDVIEQALDRLQVEVGRSDLLLLVRAREQLLELHHLIQVRKDVMTQPTTSTAAKRLLCLKLALLAVEEWGQGAKEPLSRVVADYHGTMLVTKTDLQQALTWIGEFTGYAQLPAWRL